jgi:hypothetical protein
MRTLTGMVLILSSVLSSAVFAQSSSSIRSKPAFLLDDSAPVLQIKSSLGVRYIELSGKEAIRVPVKDNRFSALLLSTRVDGKRFDVTIAGEQTGLSPVSLGHYELSLNEEKSIDVLGVEGGWEVKPLARAPMGKSIPDGCCGCSGSSTYSCPNPGSCEILSCGKCCAAAS